MPNKTFEVYDRRIQRVRTSFEAESVALQADGIYLYGPEGVTHDCVLHLFVGQTLREEGGPDVEVR